MEKPSIKMKYVFGDDYNPQYITGAFGGVTPQRELVANFYFERPAIPRTVTHEIKEDGTLGDIIGVQPEEQNIVIRYVQNGIIMNLETAKQVNVWLTQFIDLLEKGVEISGSDND